MLKDLFTILSQQPFRDLPQEHPVVFDYLRWLSRGLLSFDPLLGADHHLVSADLFVRLLRPASCVPLLSVLDRLLHLDLSLTSVRVALLKAALLSVCHFFESLRVFTHRSYLLNKLQYLTFKVLPKIVLT